MEVKGKIIQKFDLMSGTSKAGNAWKKQEYLLETLDSFPRKIHFREYQGRWYTSIRGWKAEKIDEATAAAPQAAPAPQGAPAPAPVPLTDTTFEQSPADDLPF